MLHNFEPTPSVTLDPIIQRPDGKWYVCSESWVIIAGPFETRAEAQGHRSSGYDLDMAVQSLRKALATLTGGTAYPVPDLAKHVNASAWTGYEFRPPLGRPKGDYWIGLMLTGIGIPFFALYALGAPISGKCRKVCGQIARDLFAGWTGRRTWHDITN